MSYMFDALSTPTRPATVLSLINTELSLQIESKPFVQTGACLSKAISPPVSRDSFYGATARNTCVERRPPYAARFFKFSIDFMSNLN